MMSKLTVNILGATGAVGRTLLGLLEKSHLPVSGVNLYASKRSAGKQISYKSGQILVQELSHVNFAAADLTFICTGSQLAREYQEVISGRSRYVVDNSSAFRMVSEVPLVIPEINASSIDNQHRWITNPNCSAAILLTAIAPLQKLDSFERISVSTYQSASGGGAKMMDDLLDQTRCYLDDKPIQPKTAVHPYAFNLFSHNSEINEYGYNEEEWKVIEESRKILGIDDLKINVTCVRVPVLRAHSKAVNLEFKNRRPSVQEIRDCLRATPGVEVVDSREENLFPMPSLASKNHKVLVGRVREDFTHPHGINLFISGDQLLKGAALNSLQIAEYLFESGRLN